MFFGGTEELGESFLQFSLSDGKTLVFFQMRDEILSNTKSIFGLIDNGSYKILNIFDFSHIIGNINIVLEDYSGPIFVSPYGWMDINDNGKPDIPISYMWGNQYFGSELHIFEFNGEEMVITTKDLPGIISPWGFDPEQENLYILDLQWAYHDCIYPPFGISNPIVWDGEQYVDDSENRDYSEYINRTAEYLRSEFGSPFRGWTYIPEMVRILVLSERMGERANGWKLYNEIANPDNWPESDEFGLSWLKFDQEHFRRQYVAGVPFSANFDCPPHP